MKQPKVVHAPVEKIVWNGPCTRRKANLWCIVHVKIGKFFLQRIYVSLYVSMLHNTRYLGRTELGVYSRKKVLCLATCHFSVQVCNSSVPESPEFHNCGQASELLRSFLKPRPKLLPPLLQPGSPAKTTRLHNSGHPRVRRPTLELPSWGLQKAVAKSFQVIKGKSGS